MISLRDRLLFSYLFLLVFTLGGIVLALLVTTGSQPAPAESTYQRLAPLARNLDYDALINQVIQSISEPPPIGGGPVITATPQADETRQLSFLLDALIELSQTAEPEEEPTPPDLLALPVTEPSQITAQTRSVYLNQMAAQNQVRVIQFVVDRRLNDIIHGFTTFDSLGQLSKDQLLRFRLDDWKDPLSTLEDEDTLVFGRFVENGENWLFSGELVTGPSGQQSATIVAERRPTVSLQAILANFGMSLFLPLVQAAFIGLLLAVVLSALISRTIARPLQAASEAALAITRGDLSKRVPMTGPREVRAVASAFNRMTEEVQKTQQAQRDFLANVSHDLKTPLTSIQGYSQAIMEGAARSPAHAAEIIYEEATRLSRLVNELTDLARIQAGQFPMQKESIDLGQITWRVGHKLAVVAEEKGITLHVDAPSMPPIVGDGDRIVQVLTNLISNAIKFTPENGLVDIETHEQHGGVEVVIRDTGIGIPQEELPRIFERFYQVDKTRGPSRGTGLGLAITYEIVRAHGGRIEADSREGVGTTFRVWLPRQDESTAETAVPVLG